VNLRIPAEAEAEIASARCEVDESESMPRRRSLLWISLLILCGIVGYSAYFVNRVFMDAIVADGVDHSYQTTLSAVILHIEERNDWPKNWEALTPFLQRVDPDPERIAAVPTRVHVDFTLSLNDVAKMTQGGFVAIEPIEPNYGRAEGAISQLLDVARSSRAKQ
jgi:hypothetical protein